MIAFVLAQLSDMATMRPSHELNHLALGAFAFPEKALMILAVCLIAYALGRGRYGSVQRPLLAIGTLVGTIGAFSNVLAWQP